MDNFQLSYLCLVLVMFAADLSSGCRRASPVPSAEPPGSGDRGAAAAATYMCGICGQPITVTLVARNQLQSPFFEKNVTVAGKHQQELIHFLEEAATMDPTFKFTADHFGSLGYMVNSLNKLSASPANKTYWAIVQNTKAANSLDLGVSAYVPMNAQTIIFNFTTWGN